MEAVVRPRGDSSEWTGWRYESTGRTVEEAVDMAAFGILRDIMEGLIGLAAMSPWRGNLRCVFGALGQARDDRRQLQRDHDAKIERLNAEVAQLTC
jgi:hypothetical protein